MEKTRGYKKGAAVFPHIDKHSFRLLLLELPIEPYYPEALPDDRLSRQGISNDSSVKTLCAALHSKSIPAAIKQHIQIHKIRGTAGRLLPTDDWPALYYTAQRNSGEPVSILLQAGA
jgi:hypothetical protein